MQKQEKVTMKNSKVSSMSSKMQILPVPENIKQLQLLN